jgi:hypothetical protein
MRTPKTLQRLVRLLVLSLMAILLLAGALPGYAQDEPAVQILDGRIESGEVMYYRLENLKVGDTLYAYLRNTSGNLNPLLALSEAGVDFAAIRPAVMAQLDALIAQGVGPVEALEQVVVDLFLMVDDNGGVGSDAALIFPIEKDGDYVLLAVSALTSETFGDFELSLGINAEEVVTGDARPTGDVIGVLDAEASGIASAVQNVTGVLTAERSSTFFTVRDMKLGDTLFVFVETTSGDLIPLVKLLGYGGGVLRNPNAVAQQSSSSFAYTFTEDAENFLVELEACCEETELTEGEYRLLVGFNEPAVLNGLAPQGGRQVLQGAFPVQAKVQIQQITDVDQIAENYSVVAQIEFLWNDPALAFNPDECRCRFKSFLGESYKKFIGAVGDEPFQWPEFTIFNQQGNRWTQNQGLVIWPNGDALYLERFSTTLQAPDFDFTAFPFDTQQFFLRIDSIFPEDFYLYEDSPEGSGMGDQLGEEEWVVTSTSTEISSGETGSRYSFGFTAKRHLSFYFFRIIVPTLLIVTVSWFTFFLKDYGKRVDVMLANLLVFVAFNFTVSGELPRLGYLTFLDTFLAGTFIITAVILILNVALRRLEVAGKEDLAHRIDSLTLWIYPVGYVGFLVWLYFNFLSERL